MPALGRDSRALWQFDANWTNFNHGSYGATPSAVLAVQRDWVREMEANPEMFVRFWQYGFRDAVLAKIARYVNARAADVVFVDNASHGVNAVLRSLAERLPRGSKVLELNLAYTMVKNTLGYCAAVFGEQVVIANVSYANPLRPTPSDVTAAVGAALSAHGGAIKLVSISHITSLPALVMPVAQVAALAHAHGALLLVDGAHALGQLGALDVPALGADFWVGNGHKWLYSPKGSAVLWVAPGQQHLIFPTTISQEGQGATRFQRDFSYEGTDDPTAFLAMAAALDFRAALPGGEAGLVSHVTQLAQQGGALLAKLWGTDVLEAAFPPAFLTNVRLPSTNGTAVGLLQDQLLRQHATFVVCEGNGEAGGATGDAAAASYWMRISAQAYLSLGDFEWLGKVVLDALGGRG